ncbi:MAG: type II secretion system F family protein [Acidobacteriota bacterium]
MTPTTLTLIAVFLAVTFTATAVAWLITSRSEPGRQRLKALLDREATGGLVRKAALLAEEERHGADRLVSKLPTSFGSVKRLRRELALAGFYSATIAAWFSISELVGPVLFAIPPLVLLTGTYRWGGAAAGLVLGYLAPSMLLKRRCKRRQHEIENGLADALDLLVLCLEAGSSLDQAIVKAGDELGVSYPALGEQLHILIMEMRAGKTRLDAFQGLAERTRLDDVRALVSMLMQTDRFGTSVSQALRTQADTSRTKRRQRAEERAQKVGVKLVFPLVFCLFPALYVVLLGPAYLTFVKILSQ